MAFRAYTVKEVRDAAKAYGVNPDFAEAIYARESSRGTNPKALTTRAVKRKKDTTFVRGPFQLEDDTTSDLIRDNKLTGVNVDDPDAHLDLAMRLMKKLQDQYRGDPVKMAQAYLGGPGGVGTNTQDELGTTTGAYGNDVVAEMQRLQKTSSYAPSADEMDELLMGESPPDDMLGIPAMPPMGQSMPIEHDPLGLPMSISHATGTKAGSEFDLHRYLSALVDDELQGKDYGRAA